MEQLHTELLRISMDDANMLEPGRHIDNSENERTDANTQ